MTEIRKEVDEEIDRMTDRQAIGLSKLLAADASPLAAALRTAAESNEPEPADGSRLVVEAMEWLRKNAG